MTVTFSALPPGLRSEVEEVYASLESVAEALSFPLNNLVRAEISRAVPFVRAGAVLAVAYHDAEDGHLREQRIFLASALEMLHIALNIHKLLLPTTSVRPNPDNERGHDTVHDTVHDTESIPPTDKLVMGSTILAGDYCFSRSADMATKTGNPEVVNIFAEALKSVSEAHLRSLFDDSALSSQEANTILVAGIKAASKLTDASENVLSTHVEISKMLLDSLNPTNRQTAPVQDRLPKYAGSLSKPQLNRWHEIIGWITS